MWGAPAHLELQGVHLVLHDAVQGGHGAAAAVAHGADIPHDVRGAKVLGAHGAVNALVHQHLVELGAVYLGYHLIGAQEVCVHGDYQVLLVEVRKSHNGVGLSKTFGVKDIPVGAVGVYNRGLWKVFRELHAPGRVLLDKLHVHTGP